MNGDSPQGPNPVPLKAQLVFGHFRVLCLHLEVVSLGKTRMLYQVPESCHCSVKQRSSGNTFRYVSFKEYVILIPVVDSSTIPSSLSRFICQVRPCDVIERLEANLEWETVFSMLIVLRISLIVSCLNSEISLISVDENLLEAKKRLYLPSRINEIKPAFLRIPK